MQSVEEMIQEMNNFRDASIREFIERKPIDTLDFYDLDFILDQTDRYRSSFYMIEINNLVRKARDDLIEAGRNGPQFVRGQIVEVAHEIKIHNKATSVKPPVRLRGRVVEMIDPTTPEQIGLVSVKFPPKPLGYSGREHVHYCLRNTDLKAVK